MKFTLLLAFFVSSMASAATVETWTTINEAHPLWDNLNVKIEKLDSDLSNVSVKKVGPVRCTRIFNTEYTPYSTTPEQTITCKITIDQNDPDGAIQLFKALLTKSKKIRYTEYKRVGKLFVSYDQYDVKAAERNRVVVGKECSANDTFEAQQECLKFIVEEIMPDFIAENSFYLLEANPRLKDDLLNVNKWSVEHPETKAKVGLIIEDSFKNKNPAGWIIVWDNEVQHYYIVIDKNTGLPNELIHVNTVDIPYSKKLNEIFLATDKSQRKALVESIMSGFTLGLDYDLPEDQGVKSAIYGFKIVLRDLVDEVGPGDK